MGVDVPWLGIARLCFGVYGVFCTAKGIFKWGRGTAAMWDKFIGVLGMAGFAVVIAVQIIKTW